jgi:hypothetical protein
MNTIYRHEHLLIIATQYHLINSTDEVFLLLLETLMVFSYTLLTCTRRTESDSGKKGFAKVSEIITIFI